MDHARLGVGGVLISLTLAMSGEPIGAGGQTTKVCASVPYAQCDARPTVTFPAAEHHHPLAGTKLYCLVIRHMGVNNLPRVVAWLCTGRESNPGPLNLKSDTLTTTPPSHPTQQDRHLCPRQMHLITSYLSLYSAQFLSHMLEILYIPLQETLSFFAVCFKL